MELNVLLAGPIVRRVEQDAAYLWVATSVPASVIGEVYQASTTYQEKPERLGGGPAESLQIGEKLFVHLVRATPDAGTWPRGELLAYDLRLLPDDDCPALRLADLGLLEGPNSIAYAGLDLPTFFLPAENRSLSVIHGSCRLLHGRGEDALGAADEIITRSATDLDERPSVLCLTGDQIYADDVAQPLISHIRSMADALIGDQDDRSVPGLARVSDLDVGQRSEFVQEQACFTSDHCDDHLLSFGEYAAIHCLAWNHENWPPELPRDIPGGDGNMLALPKDLRSRRSFLGQRRALERARAALPAVRRVLANTPTYMVFDDHDVTDDWNLTEEWKDRVYGCAAGKRIVSNALGAFFAFQGWGNQPEQFDASIKTAIANFTLASEDEFDSAGATYDSVLWSWNEWSFYTPTQPPIFCLDTRTQRSYDSAKGAARLVGHEGLKRVVSLAAAAGHEKGDALVLVSPVPVFGFELQERRQKYLVDKLGPYDIDFEAWHSNLRGLVEFMKVVIEELEPSHVVLLSGDVHYGVNARASFVVGDREMPFVQLVSSGQKHAGVIAKSGINVLGRLLKGRHERIGWDQPPEVGRFEGFKDKIFNRPANTDEWSGVSPIFIAPRDVKFLGIEQEPDYKECRVYIRPLESMSSYLVGENNIGLVKIDGTKVSHQIHGKEMNETVVKTAEVDAGTGSLFD
jgi:hypothetical protein